MLRSLLLNTAARAKTVGGADFFIRYNPYLRAQVMQSMQRFRDPALAGAAEQELTQRILRAAQNTTYGANRPQPLSDWPVLERKSLQQAPEDFVNRRALVRIPAGTGGTSGIPLRLWRSVESITAEQAFIDSLLLPYGFSMHDSRVAVLRADSVKSADDHAPPYGRTSHGGKRLTLSSRHLNPETLPWFYDALMRFAPSVLWVYPSAAANLHRLFAEAELRLEIPVILSSSENLSPASHKALAEYFNSAVINYYGQAERVCFAHSTQPGEFFFHPCYGRVELEPVPGETGKTFRILGTSYWNAAMPLLRYSTGDTLSVPANCGAKEIEGITRGTRSFAAVDGREGEYVLTRDGMRIIGLNQIPREIKNAYQLQIVQAAPDAVRIDVLAMPGFGEKDAAQIRNQAKAKLPGSLEVTVRAVRQLKMTAGGKTPFVIREISAAK